MTTPPRVSVLMPVKGRPQQTAECIDRMLKMAGPVSWELIVVVDEDRAVFDAIQGFRDRVGILNVEQRQGYWKALAHATERARGSILVNCANDVLAGMRWLSRAVEAYDRQRFDERGGGVIGFNDGILFDAHTGHLLCSRELLQRWYGSGCWPTIYDHLYGDTEICQRAMAEQCYAVALKAVLFHNHPVIGKSVDEVYRFSHTKETEDAEIFQRRRATGWPK